MAHPIKLIIFDLDGTLVDAYQAVSRSLNFALKKNGLPTINDEVIKKNVGWGEKVLVGRFVPSHAHEKTLSVYRKHHRHALKKGTKFLPGAKTVLNQLKKQGFKLAIASNRPSGFTKIILKHLKIYDHFSCVLCADQVARPKPYGDLLKAILKKFALKGNEALYVGDMTIDVVTGRRARVKTVAVLTGSCPKKEIGPYRPYRMINKIKEMDAILKELNDPL